jgi:chromosome segregation ATPase
MRNFLQNLLIFLALCLCGLLVWEWVKEAHLTRKLELFATELHNKTQTIQDLTGMVKRTEDEVKRLEGIKDLLNATIKTNQQEILGLRKDLDKVTGENERNLKQIEVYKEAMAKANENLTLANQNIQTLNEDRNKIVAQLNEMGAKYKKAVEDFNGLATKWNKLQEDLTKTNAPPAPKK